ncbi:MAG TPA: hypothetical protein VNQ90_00535 [Chthoniobacteraceae bacterium]|nr:hypothetical protein [Chthoniobacteraceae bacterium]
MTAPPVNRLKRPWLLRLAALVVLVAIGYAFYPRRGNFHSFDPAEMAALETIMWRRYYEGRYLSLAWNLYTITRHQYGLRPASSLKTAYHAAMAARMFRKSRGRAEAERAIPHLEKAYRCISDNTGSPFDTQKAAEMELHWWQQRREHVPTEGYARTIGDLMTLVHKVDDPRMRHSALLRARMMAYRDARRNGQMKEEDWEVIRKNLTEAYQLYHDAVTSVTTL